MGRGASKPQCPPPTPAWQPPAGEPAPSGELTGVFWGKNSFGTSLAGLLHYVPSTNSKEFGISGFYTKTSKPEAVIPLAGTCIRGRVVLWTTQTMVNVTAGNPEDAQKGSDGELSLERPTNTLLLLGMYQGRVNNWTLEQRWIRPMGAQARAALAGDTGYNKMRSWIQGVPTAKPLTAAEMAAVADAADAAAAVEKIAAVGLNVYLEQAGVGGDKQVLERAAAWVEAQKPTSVDDIVQFKLVDDLVNALGLPLIPRAKLLGALQPQVAVVPQPQVATDWLVMGSALPEGR